MMRADTISSIREVIVIGAGPAGLTGACYLGRFRRPCVVLNQGASRARWIPKSHNTPGFPDGVSGEDLLARLRDQAMRYGAQIHEGQVLTLRREGPGFSVETATEIYRSRYVLLATGVKDELPPASGAEAAIQRGLLKVCPICDAFESRGKNIAVIGTSEHALREAQFLQTYSDRITFVNVGEHTDAFQQQIEAAGIRYRRARSESLVFNESAVKVTDDRNETHAFDLAYSALGCRPMNQLACKLGAQCDEKGALKVDGHQQTSIPGLYAAGDVVRGLNQIVVAAAEAAAAAIDIHNQLRETEQRQSTGDATRPPS